MHLANPLPCWVSRILTWPHSTIARPVLCGDAEISMLLMQHLKAGLDRSASIEGDGLVRSASIEGDGCELPLTLTLTLAPLHMQVKAKGLQKSLLESRSLEQCGFDAPPPMPIRVRVSDEV